MSKALKQGLLGFALGVSKTYSQAYEDENEQARTIQAEERAEARQIAAEKRRELAERRVAQYKADLELQQKAKDFNQQISLIGDAGTTPQLEATKLETAEQASNITAGTDPTLMRSRDGRVHADEIAQGAEQREIDARIAQEGRAVNDKAAEELRGIDNAVEKQRRLDEQEIENDKKRMGEGLSTSGSTKQDLNVTFSEASKRLQSNLHSTIGWDTYDQRRRDGHLAPIEDMSKSEFELPEKAEDLKEFRDDLRIDILKGLIHEQERELGDSSKRRQLKQISDIDRAFSPLPGMAEELTDVLINSYSELDRVAALAADPKTSGVAQDWLDQRKKMGEILGMNQEQFQRTKIGSLWDILKKQYDRRVKAAKQSQGQ